MIHQILWALLLVIIFVWLFYFYGNERRAEETEKLLEKSMILRAVNDGLMLGLSMVGIAFWVIIPFVW